jgi:Zn-dependent protease
MTWWMHDAYYTGGMVQVTSWIFWVVFSITLHELGHGWAALWQGDDTPRVTGHMTWNPLVHMGPWSLLMFALIGIAWGLMPTDPSKYRWRRKGRVVVALAGPAVNIGLAFLALTALAVWLRYGTPDTVFDERLQVFLWTGGMLNIFLALFNVLPIPPLDGSQVLMGLSDRFYVWFHHPVVRQYAFFGIIALFFIFNLGSGMFLLAQRATQGYLGLLSGLLGSGS